MAPFEAAILAFERAYMQLVDEIEASASDPQRLREIYVRLYQGIERLKTSQAYLATHLKLKSHQIVEAAGGTLEPKWGKNRKQWDHAALKSIVSEKILASHVDHTTGVIAAPLPVLMLEMLDAVSFSSWKVTVLRKLGIDDKTIARYCDEEPGNFNVVVRLPTKSPITRSDDDQTSS